MSIDPKTTSNNTLKGKILGSSIFTTNSIKSWHNNRLFLGSALFASAGGAVGFVSAKVVDGNKDFQEEFETVPSTDLKNQDNSSHETKVQGNNKEDFHIDFTSSLPCGNPDDSLNFGEAFKGQRADLGQGGVFEYRGKYYNTFYKEEWEAMSDEQKHEYYLAIDDKIDYNQSRIVINGQNSTSVKEHNEIQDGLANNIMIPDSQIDEFIPFEYGQSPLEKGPGAAHLDPDLDIPSTIVVNSYEFNLEEDNGYEQIERNGSNGDDDLYSDNDLGDEDLQNYSNVNVLDGEQIVEVDKIHLVASDEEITIVDKNDTHHQFFLKDEELFEPKITDNDEHHLDSHLEDFHSHE